MNSGKSKCTAGTYVLKTAKQNRPWRV